MAKKGTIIFTKEVAPNIFEMIIEAPNIAKKIKPGQFIVLMATEKGERIPLTVAGTYRWIGYIALYVQRAGKTTSKLTDMEAGSILYSLSGPHGQQSEIEKVDDNVVFVCGGVGTAVMYPVLRANKEIGNKVITILGAKNKDTFILKDDIQEISDQTIVCTDDGSCGKKGFTTNALEELIESGEKISKVVVAGPPIMMKLISDITRKYNIPTIASLVTIMVDGTGMCGGCRVGVNGKSLHACVEGPEFNAHQIDWDVLLSRQNIYKKEEQISMEKYKEKRCCREKR